MEEAKIIREMIRVENELIDRRLTWLSTFQGLLLAALVFAWDKHDAGALVVALYILGFLIALSTGIATWRANDAIGRLETDWDTRLKPENYKGVDIVGARTRSGRLWWLMPGYLIPTLFGVAWVVIGAVRLR